MTISNFLFLFKVPWDRWSLTLGLCRQFNSTQGFSVPCISYSNPLLPSQILDGWTTTVLFGHENIYWQHMDLNKNISVTKTIFVLVSAVRFVFAYYTFSFRVGCLLKMLLGEWCHSIIANRDQFSWLYPK